MYPGNLSRPARFSLHGVVALSLLFSLLLLAGLPPGPTRAQDNPTETPAPPGTIIHIVQSGENLFRIAQRYGTTIETIARANSITNVTAIQVGQRLMIPNAAPDAPGIPTDYVVGPADSLVNLAFRFGTTVPDIARANRIVSAAGLYVGMKLTVPDQSSGQPGLNAGWVYVVQPDDNLYRVAARYGVPVESIQKANRLKRASVLFPGQRLAIPGPEGSPALMDVPALYSALAMQPRIAEQGRTFSIRITTTRPVSLSGSFMGGPLAVFSDPARTTHIILRGIQAFAQPGIYPMALTATDDQGTQTTLARSVEVIDGGYTSEALTLAPSQLDLLNPAVTQPEADRVLSLVSKVTAQRYFSGPLGLPCPAPVTSQFGTRRSYNGGPFDQLHAGTDFAGAPGSPIYAPATGVVVLAEALNVRGNATIIDHGWGVYTGYWHQTEIRVKVGDTVQQGQVLGTIGKTGRVTGPHLHWELFVGGVQVDPLQWVRQSFP